MELKPDLAAMMGILFILLGITFLPYSVKGAAE